MTTATVYTDDDTSPEARRAEKHPALAQTRQQLEHHDKNRELYERRNDVHRLTRAGNTDSEIANTVGMSERNVQRHLTKPPPPSRPQLYNAAAASNKRCNELEAMVDLALHLACLLQEEDPVLVWGSLIRLERRALQEIAVITLAAIPLNMTKTQLLGWVSDLGNMQGEL